MTTTMHHGRPYSPSILFLAEANELLDVARSPSVLLQSAEAGYTTLNSNRSLLSCPCVVQHSLLTDSGSEAAAAGHVG